MRVSGYESLRLWCIDHRERRGVASFAEKSNQAADTQAASLSLAAKAKQRHELGCGSKEAGAVAHGCRRYVEVVPAERH